MSRTTSAAVAVKDQVDLTLFGTRELGGADVELLFVHIRGLSGIRSGSAELAVSGALSDGKYPAFSKVSDESIAVLGTGVADKIIMAL